MRSRILALVGAVALAAVTAACGSSSGGAQNGTGESPDTSRSAATDPAQSGSDPTPDSDAGPSDAHLTLLISAANTDLDPASTVNDSSFQLTPLYAIYERILTFNSAGELQPGLATDWAYTDDTDLTLRITLRDGAEFQDGTPVDSKAVKANIERSMNLGDGAGKTVMATAANVASVDVVDDHVLDINLKKVDGGFAYQLGMQFGMMISPKSLDGSTGPALKAVGAGPYELVKFNPGDVTELKRFDKFWDGPGQRPAEMTIKTVTADQSRLNAIRSGEATVAELTPNLMQTAKSAGLTVVENSTASLWTIAENTSGALKDLRVRQAVMYAIDRNALVQGLAFGSGEPTVQMLLKGAVGHVDEDDDAYPFDQAKAKELLAEAGYPDGLTLEFYQLNEPAFAQIAEALQQQLAAVGIKLTIETFDISGIGKFISGEKADLMLSKWGGRADSLATLSLAVGPDATYSPAGVVSDKLTNLMVAAAAIPADAQHDTERAQAIAAANKEATEQVAIMPLFTRKNIWVFNDQCVTGLDPYMASGAQDWRNVTVGDGC